MAYYMSVQTLMDKFNPGKLSSSSFGESSWLSVGFCAPLRAQTRKFNAGNNEMSYR